MKGLNIGKTSPMQGQPKGKASPTWRKEQTEPTRQNIQKTNMFITEDNNTQRQPAERNTVQFSPDVPNEQPAYVVYTDTLGILTRQNQMKRPSKGKTRQASRK